MTPIQESEYLKYRDFGFDYWDTKEDGSIHCIKWKYAGDVDLILAEIFIKKDGKTEKYGTNENETI